MNATLSNLLAVVDMKNAKAQERVAAMLRVFWAGKRDAAVSLHGLRAVKFIEHWLVNMIEPGQGGEDERLAIRKALPIILNAYVERGEEKAAYEIQQAYERQNEAEVMAIRADRDGAQSFLNWYEHAADAEMYVLARPQYIRTCLALGLEI